MISKTFSCIALNVTLTILLLSCSPSGPTDEEILELAKKSFIGSSSSFLIEIKINEKKSSRNLSERNDLVIFPVIVKCNYVRQGFKTGWIAGGGFDSFFTHNADRLHMVLPADHPVLPWTALVVGLWIPNIYYWGLNQYITQRTLAAKSLREGQKGIIFAAAIKIIIPFIIVFPGIMAAQLYSDSMSTTDAAYPLLIRNLIPTGLKGFMLAAIAGAVISSLASMLNSASTIFTLDLYKVFIKKDSSQKNLVFIGRIMTILFVLIGCLIAPYLGDPRFMGIFTYIQEFQGYISPGILAAFVFGILVKKAPPMAGVLALLACVPIYGFLQWQFGEIAFLNRMAITFGVILLLMTVITLIKPLKEPKVLPKRNDIDLTPTPQLIWFGSAVILVTLLLYVIFW